MTLLSDSKHDEYLDITYHLRRLLTECFENGVFWPNWPSPSLQVTLSAQFVTLGW
jgi:hypothetical protein